MDFSKQIVKKSKSDRQHCFRWRWITILTVLWILLIIVHNPFGHERYEYSKYCSEDTIVGRETVTPLISEGTVIQQPFTAHRDGLGCIGFFMGTYQRTNDSSFEMQLVDEAGAIIVERTVDASALVDNSYYYIRFPAVEDSANKNYTIVIRGIDGNSDNSPAIWIGQSTQYPAAIVNGTTQGLTLQLQLQYEQPEAYVSWWILVMVCSYGVVCCISCGKYSLDKLFVVIAMVMGILFVFLNPFRHALDEDTHFFKSYSISDFKFVEQEENGAIGNVLSKSMKEINNYRGFGLKTNTQYMMAQFVDEESFYVNSHASSIIPLHHCIPAVGILIARLFKLSIGWTIYAGRLVNYLFYVFVCYHAIKSTKYYKSLFFIVALLPANLWMAGSYSTDPSLLSTSLLLVSLCFKYRYSDETKMISLKDCALILWCGMMIISVKFFVYAPIALCFFMIPKRCFKSKQRGAMIGAAAVIVVLIVVWQFMVSGNFLAGGDSRGGDTDLVRQLKFMLQNPIGAIRVFVNYYRTTAMSHLTGTYAPGNYTGVSGLLSLACVFAAVIATDKFTLTSRERKNTNLFFIAVFAVIVLLSTASMYLRFTPVGSADIAGVQTRYFFPAMILPMAALANNRVKNESNTYGANVAMMLTVFLVTQLILQLNNAFA